MSKYFDHTIYRFGTAKLVNKHGKYFFAHVCNVVGVDRGINFAVATYDSKHKSGFVSGRAIKQKRAKYLKLRSKTEN